MEEANETGIRSCITWLTLLWYCLLMHNIFERVETIASPLTAATCSFHELICESMRAAPMHGDKNHDERLN